MTKEEILDSYSRNVEYPSYIHESNALDAMDEYAMQESIGFLRWSLENRVEPIDDTHDRGPIYILRTQKKYLDHITGFSRYQTYSEPELYQLYLNSKK